MAEPGVRFKQDDGSSFPKWKEYTISDLFSKIGAKNINGKNTNVITNSAEFGLIPQRDYFDKDIAVEGRTDNYTVIQTGDFVYNPRKSSYAPMGPFNCYRLEEDGIVSPLYSCLRPKGILNPDYLLWYFQTDKWYGYVNDHGAQNGARHDRVGMTDSILMGIPVTAPCEEEQQKIADFLSSVDEVIVASEQEVANLEIQKKTVMKKLFSQEVRFKRDDESDFPEWEEKELAVLFPYIRNGFVGTITDFFTEKENGIRYLQGTNIHNGLISDNVEFYVTKEFHQKHINNELKEDDIIMVQSGHVGDCAVVGKKYAGSNCHALIIMSNAGECCSDFYVDYFHSPEGLKEIAIKATGNTVKHILASVMQGFRVPYPCLEEQRLIANFLSDFDEVIIAAKKELELWKELKKGLLQQMFV